MIARFTTFYDFSASFFQERLYPLLIQNKKIISIGLIAAAALGLFVIVYLTIRNKSIHADLINPSPNHGLGLSQRGGSTAPEETVVGSGVDEEASRKKNKKSGSLEVSEKSEAIHGFAALLLSQNKYVEAGLKYQEAYDLDLDDEIAKEGCQSALMGYAASLKEFGLELSKQENYTEAAEQYHKVLEIFPDDDSAIEGEQKTRTLASEKEEKERAALNEFEKQKKQAMLEDLAKQEAQSSIPEAGEAGKSTDHTSEPESPIDRIPSTSPTAPLPPMLTVNPLTEKNIEAKKGDEQKPSRVTGATLLEQIQANKNKPADPDPSKSQSLAPPSSLARPMAFSPSAIRLVLGRRGSMANLKPKISPQKEQVPIPQGNPTLESSGGSSEPSDDEEDAETPPPTPSQYRIVSAGSAISKLDEPKSPQPSVSPGQNDSGQVETPIVILAVPPTPPPLPKQVDDGSLGRSSRRWSSAPTLTDEKKKEPSPIKEGGKDLSETSASQPSFTQDVISQRLQKLKKTGIDLEQIDKKFVPHKDEVSKEVLDVFKHFMERGGNNAQNPPASETTSSGENWDT